MSATRSGFWTPSPSLTRCAPPAPWACRPLRSGASAPKTIRSGRSGTPPSKSDPVKELAEVDPGHDVDTEGEGDILRVSRARSPAIAPSRWTTTTTIPSQYLSVISRDDGLLPAVLHGRAVRLPSQTGGHHLRRWARPRMDAEDSRRPQALQRQGHFLHDRRDRPGQRRRHAACLPRRP